MMLPPPEDSKGKLELILSTRQGRGAFFLLAVVVFLTGCATSPPHLADPAELAEAPESAPTLQPTALDTVPVDRTLPDTPPDPVPSSLPVGPDGYAALEDLETLADEILVLLSEHEADKAKDHLFVLRDQVELPLPAGADSLYAEHRTSLRRRVGLLGAVMTEQIAFGAAPEEADTLLASGYHRLAAVDFPDSLVPASGVTLSDMAADLLKVENQAVGRWIDYFCGRGHRSFQSWLDRKAAADSLVTGILTEAGLPPELIYLAVIESGLSSTARSSVGAVGPWQFMAGTAKSFDLRKDWWVDERRDLEMSTRAAATYLKGLYKQFGDWSLVLAAYNTGENRVQRKIRQHGHDNFWDLHLPNQTSQHIPKFIAAARIGADPEKYGFTVPDQPSLGYDILEVTDATDLELVADCAGVDASVLKRLNPALVRGATPPGRSDYPVRVPRGTGARALASLKKIPLDQRLTWRRHKVQRGETLSEIARSYGTSAGDIARLNKLKDVHLIRPGMQLVIPMPADLASRARSRAAEKGHYVPPDGYVRVSYKVKKGDTLGHIATNLGVTVRHLRKVNGIYKSHLIYPGQRLYAYRPPSG